MSRYILRSIVFLAGDSPLSLSLILFHPWTHRTAHDPPDCQDQSSASPEQGVVNQPPLYPRSIVRGERASAYTDFLPSLRRVSTGYLSSPSALISERDQSHHGRWMFRRIYALYTICSTRLSFPTLHTNCCDDFRNAAQQFDSKFIPLHFYSLIKF